MSDGTAIEWTDATLNVVNGCSVVSPGCTNCYAMRSGGRKLPHHPATGLTKATKAGHVWTGEVRFNDKALLQPLRWKRPRKIFWNAHGDLFHEKVPDEWIDRCFAVMALTPHHIHQVLTKRPERMRQYVCAQRDAPRFLELPGEGRVWTPFEGGVMKCIWLGVSVEDQQRAAERIPQLLATPAAVRWLSCEPLLGPVDLTKFEIDHDLLPYTATRDDVWAAEPLKGRLAPIIRTGPEEWDLDGGGHGWGKIDWIIAGGESGHGARPMHPDWARSLRDQCARAKVPFLFKQWGEFGPDRGQDEDFDRDGYRRDRVMEGAGPCAAWIGGRWELAADGYAMPLDLPGDNHEWLYRLGKKRNGRLLDGIQHDGFPA